MTKKCVMSVLMAVVASSCSSAPSPLRMPNAPTFERGFQIFPSPRTFDGPGTVFRVDDDGVRHDVADLSSMLTIVPREEAIPTISVTGRFNTSAFFSWLGGRARGGQYDRVDSALVAVFGAKREEAFEVDLKQLADSALHVVDWTRPGRLYVISETIAADSVLIRLSSSVAATVGDSLKTDSAKKRGISVNWQPRRSANLALRFPKPYRVFYKTDQLVRRAPLEQDSLPRVVRIPGPVFWKE